MLCSGKYSFVLWAVVFHPVDVSDPILLKGFLVAILWLRTWADTEGTKGNKFSYYQESRKCWGYILAHINKKSATYSVGLREESVSGSPSRIFQSAVVVSSSVSGRFRAVLGLGLCKTKVCVLQNGFDSKFDDKTSQTFLVLLTNDVLKSLIKWKQVFVSYRASVNVLHNCAEIYTPLQKVFEQWGQFLYFCCRPKTSKDETRDQRFSFYFQVFTPGSYLKLSR